MDRQKDVRSLGARAVGLVTMTRLLTGRLRTRPLHMSRSGRNRDIQASHCIDSSKRRPLSWSRSSANGWRMESGLRWPRRAMRRMDGAVSFSGLPSLPAARRDEVTATFKVLPSSLCRQRSWPEKST
jgi:hypothetical protein